MLLGRDGEVERRAVAVGDLAVAERGSAREGEVARRAARE